MADSDTKTVDVNTENLDDFTDLMFGKAKPAEAAEDVEDEETSELDTPSATEDESEQESDDSHQDDAPAADEADEDVEDEEESPLLKVRGRKPARERINELTRQREEANRRADDLARRLDELERKSQSEKPKDTVAKVSSLPEGAPSPDALAEDGSLLYPMGEFDPTYIRDLTKFTITEQTREIREREAEEARQREVETAEQKLTESWTEKLEAAKDRLPDLHEKAVDLEETFRGIDPNYGKYLASTIMSLEYGPEVLDYLADNIGEAQKIVAAGPTLATLALGRIEAKFINEKGNVEKGKITSAPPPPSSRTKGSGARNTVAGDTDDLEAFERQFFAKK